MNHPTSLPSLPSFKVPTGSDGLQWDVDAGQGHLGPSGGAGRQGGMAGGHGVEKWAPGGRAQALGLRLGHGREAGVEDLDHVGGVATLPGHSGWHPEANA